MMKGRAFQALQFLLIAAAVSMSAVYTRAGSVPGPLLMPPVGPAARSTMPAAPGTITTPVTPTVPRGRTPGQSTITIPGASGSGAASTANPGAVRPCGTGSNAAGAIPGNAGIATAPGENPNNVAIGIPNVPAGGTPDTGRDTTTNPSVRPGVPSSC
jgi:hypothetical protein